MGEHEARVRKLVVSFNTLPDESKNTLLERMEALKKAEAASAERQAEKRPCRFFSGNAGFVETGKPADSCP